MHHFSYRGGVLHAEGVAIPRIAAEVGTPFYCYSSATLERHFRVFTEALAGLDATVCFAVKANTNVALIRTLVKFGAGCDVVSGGELLIALKAGAAPAKIVFSGVGKTEAELRLALSHGVGQINVESEAELDTLSRIADGMGKSVRIGLRVNPDVDAGTHDKISTGRKEDKFGVEWSAVPRLYRKAVSLPGINPTAVAVHIGSQITELAPFEAAFKRVRELVLQLRSDGIDIRHLDLGGGLGVPYDHNSNTMPPGPEEYGAVVKRAFDGLGCKFTFEPGRVIVANAGIMVSEIVSIKKTSARHFVIVDAGMNDLVRPAMYGARHDIIPIQEAATGTASLAVDVVGPVCETTDCFAKDYPLPATLKAGDLVAFLTAGAYGAAMASTYNARPLVPEVLISGDQYAVVRRRPNFEDMMALEQSPPWEE
jgi:diaminopimelate decarboxylase